MTDWDSIKPFVEPVVAEISQPDAVLLEVRVTTSGDGQETVEARFGYVNETSDQNRRLLEYASRLVAGAATQHTR